MFAVVYGHHAYRQPEKHYLVLSYVGKPLPRHFVAIKIVRATYSYKQALLAAGRRPEYYLKAKPLKVDRDLNLFT